MKTWKLALIVFGVILVVVGSLFFFLRSYDPKPDNLRKLIYTLMPNYGVVSTAADLTSNQKLIFGYLMEDIVKHPDNLIKPISQGYGFAKKEVDPSNTLSFHKNLLNLTGKLVAIDENRLSLKVKDVEYSVKIRKFSKRYTVELGSTPNGSEIIEVGSVRDNKITEVSGQDVILTVYTGGKEYDLISLTLL